MPEGLRVPWFEITDLSQSNNEPREVRSLHPYGYRGRQWGRILTVVESYGRPNYLIQWPDGATDYWPVKDPGDTREYR